MSSPHSHRGIVVPMITPATPDGNVDLEATERLADLLARHGLGIFALGTTGEASSVPRPQRAELVRATVRAAAGRVPVYVGVADNCVVHAVESGRSFLKQGAAAIVALVPGYYPLSPGEMYDYFAHLHDAVGGPLMVYNIPATTHMSVPLDVVERLSDLPRVVGFKDSEGTAGRMEETVRRLGGREDFALFIGIASYATRALRAGFHGVIPSSGNLRPELWQRYWALAEAGDWAGAEAVQTDLDTIAAALQRGRSLGQYLAALKASMAAEGICGPTMFPPLATLDAAAQAAVVAEVAALGLAAT